MTVPESKDNSAGRAWLVAAAWLLLLAGLAVGFGHNFSEMWDRWFPSWDRPEYGLYDRFVEGESYYTHGPLVPLVGLFIVWMLIRYTKVPARPKPVTGFLVLAASLLFHLTACLARVNFASGFALIGVLVGLVLVFWGGEALRRFWFPILLLLFMVPLPEVTIYNWNFHLRTLAAEIGVRGVNALGVIAERTGNKVFLEGDKRLVIANICNGLRTIISLLAFGALYAYVCRLQGPWRIFLFAMSVPVAVVSNSIRVISLILVAHISTVETAAGWYHDASGVLIFLIAFAMMFGLERLILWARRAAGRPAEVVPLFHDARRTDVDEGQARRLVRAVGSKAGWGAVVLLLLTAGGALWLTRSEKPIWDKETVRHALPIGLDVAGRQWEGVDRPLSKTVQDVLGTRDYLNREYLASGEGAVHLSIIFSEDNRKGVHPPERCWEGGGSDIVYKADTVVDDVEGRGQLPCREFVVVAARRRRLAGAGQDVPRQEQVYVLYAFLCGKSFTRSFWWQQLVIFANGLLARDASGALITVSTSIRKGRAVARRRAMEFMRIAVPYLERTLALARARRELPEALEVSGERWRGEDVELSEYSAKRFRVRNYLCRRYSPGSEPKEGATSADSIGDETPRPAGTRTGSSRQPAGGTSAQEDRAAPAPATEISVVFAQDYREGWGPVEAGHLAEAKDIEVEFGDGKQRRRAPCGEVLLRSGGQAKWLVWTCRERGGYARSFGSRPGALIRVVSVFQGRPGEAQRQAKRVMALALRCLDDHLP